MADERAPGLTEIALDIEVTSGKADVRIDDVPFFGPEQTLDAEATIIASLPANSILGPGRNEVQIRFLPVPSGLGNTPAFRARFGYSEAGSFPDPFSDRPFAIAVGLHPDPASPNGYRLETVVQGQPLLHGGPDRPVLTTLPDGAFQIEIALDVGVDLPAQAWKSGRPLVDDAATRNQIESLTRRAGVALAEGPQAIKRELGPMLERLSATIGISVDEAIRTEYAAYVDKTMGFEQQPYDASKSRLVFMGHGRLATLMPPPVLFLNKETHETAVPMLVYWQDADGQWQIIR